VCVAPLRPRLRLPTVDLDRQTIERRDFPIGRRGYDPAAVDAHLRALATEVEELQRAASGPAADSLAATAGTQVQGIIAAAEAAAAQIESDALASAKDVREQAAADARKTRADAVARAQAHVAAVSEATATLLQRVESMDGEAGALVDSLRAGAGRLSGDLAAAEQNMGELYDAASGRASSTSSGERPDVDAGGASTAIAADVDAPSAPRLPGPIPPMPPPVDTSRPIPVPEPVPIADTPRPVPGPVPIALDNPAISPAPAAVVESPAPNGDLDGARLIALNMALNGDSREDVGRYLADNFDLADRDKLVEEVYAAIEG
jgi:DivIVA domain-containing protein